MFIKTRSQHSISTRKNSQESIENKAKSFKVSNSRFSIRLSRTSSTTSAHESIYDEAIKQLNSYKVDSALQLFEYYLQSQEKSVVFKTIYSNLLQYLNSYSMKLLNQGNLALQILHWCEAQTLIHENSEMRVITLNNLAVTYKNLQKYQLAYNCIEQALEIVQSDQAMANKALTYMNYTGILVNLSRSQQALQVAEKAVQEAKKELSRDTQNQEKCRQYTVALYNEAIICETQNYLDKAIGLYKVAYQVTKENFGCKDEYFIRYHQSYDRAKEVEGQYGDYAKKVLVSQSRSRPIVQLARIIKPRTYETDESVCTPSGKKVSVGVKQKGYVEKQVNVQQLRKQQIRFKNYSQDNIPTPNQKQTDLDEIGVLDWTDTERSLKPKVSSPKAQASSGDPTQLRDNKDERLHFLQKMDLFEKEEAQLKRKEEQIINEVENDLYDVGKIVVIQSYHRMKRQQRVYAQMKMEKRKQGKLKSDDYKIRKLQRFFKRKLYSIKMREKTRQLVYQLKLRRYPERENQLASIVQKVYRTRNAQNTFRFQTALAQKRSYLLIRQSFIHIDATKHNFASNVGRFRFYIQQPDSLTVLFTLKSFEGELFKLEMECTDFIQNLGLLEEYIDVVESQSMQNNTILDNLKALYILSRAFLEVQRVGRRLRVKITTDTEKQLANGLRKCGVYLEKLVVVRAGRMVIQGMNDFEYTQTVVEQEENNYLVAPLCYRADASGVRQVVRIQANMRRFLARKVVGLRKSCTRRVVQKKTIVEPSEHEYVTYLVVQLRYKSGSQVYVRMERSQLKSNVVGVNRDVAKYMGQITPESFLEIFDVQVKPPLLAYSEEAQYWIQKESEYRQKKRRITNVKVFEAAARKLQGAARYYLFRRYLQICRKSRQHAQPNHEVIMKRAQIVGQNEHRRAYLVQFHLYSQPDFQSIMIQVKSLEHLYALEKVLSYQQKLFYYVDLSELLSIADKMIELVRIVKGRNQTLKVEVNSLEEVQSILLSDQKQKINIHKKDQTLKSRILLNTRDYRHTFFHKNPSLVHLGANDPIPIANQKNQNIFKKLQDTVRFYHRKKVKRIIKAKKVRRNDLESISNYVNNMVPTSDYGLALHESQDDLDETLSEVQPLRKRTEYHQNLQQDLKSLVTISEILLSVKCEIKNGQVSVQATNIATDQKYATSVSILNLLPVPNPALDFLQEHVQHMLVSQLAIQNKALVFKQDLDLQTEYLRQYYTYEKELARRELELAQKIKVEENQIPLDRTLHQHLVSLGKKVILIHECRQDQLLLEFVFDAPVLVFSIYSHSDLAQRKAFRCSADDFDCQYIQNELIYKHESQVKAFFLRTVHTIVQELHVTDGLDSNFTTFIKPHLPIILREAFIIKIQAHISSKKFQKMLKLYRENRETILFLQRLVDVYDLHYVETRYFLIRNQIRILIKELSTLDIQGNMIEKDGILTLRTKLFVIDLEEMKEEYDIYYMIENLRRFEQLTLLRTDFKQIYDFGSIKSLEFKRNAFAPLIMIIHENLHISFISNVMRVVLMNLRVPFEEKVYAKSKWNQGVAKKGKTSMFDVGFKAATKLQSAYRGQQKSKWYKMKHSKAKEREAKQKFMGTFRKRTFLRVEQKYYLVNIYLKQLESRLQIAYQLIQYHNPKETFKLYFNYVNSEMIYLKGQNIYDYLLKLIYFESGQMKFRENEYQLLMEEDEFDVDSDQSSFVIRQTASEQPRQLVNYSRQAECLYNVVYSGKQQLGRQNQQAVKINVDLAKIKKFYPNLRKSKHIMSNVSQNMMSSIKVNSQGKLIYDKARIIPELLKSDVQGTQLFEKGSKPSKPVVSQTLVKTTTCYGKTKYLVIVSYLEKRIQSIMAQSKDEVFEDFESLFQVKGVNLSVNHSIVWEMSPKEAQILSLKQSKLDIAHTIAKSVQVINGRFVFIVKREDDFLQLKLDPNVVILFHEAAVKPIQRKFRFRVFQQNFKRYHQTMKQYRDEKGQLLKQVGYFGLNALKSKHDFITLCIEDENKKILVLAWNLLTFLEYAVEIPKTKYIGLLAESRQECMRAFVKHVKYESEYDKLVFNPPRADLLLEEASP